MTSSRRIIGPIVGVAIVVLGGSGIYWRIAGRNEAAGAEPSETNIPESASASFNTAVAIPVSAAEVVRDTLVVSVTAAAEAAAWRRTELRAQVGGQIRGLTVVENRSVTPRRVLVSLDTTDLALQLADARAALASAEADYRERTLFDDQIQDPAIKAERDQVARAKSGVDRAEVGVQQALLALDRSRTRAPFSGRIADIQVVQGQWVREGDVLMTIVDIDPIKVEVRVLESEVGYLREGGGAAVSFAAFPGETFTGAVATINPVIDAATRTARVTVTVPNPLGRVLPGMYARVSLEAQRFPDRILVPKAAILERSNRTMLFVYEPDGRTGLAKWHYVTTGLENDWFVEIVDAPDTDMLEPGQQVLIDGHYTLIHDASVRLVGNVRAAGGRPQ
ncbi:MAG: efflux RND transporter periplasmic adaptor subunit [Gemmatimonadales bacterium]